jgi:hypothetical protein
VVTDTPSDAADARVGRLDNPALVGAIYLGSVALLLAATLRSPYPYGDPRFVVDLLRAELLLALALDDLILMTQPVVRRRKGWIVRAAAR